MLVRLAAALTVQLLLRHIAQRDWTAIKRSKRPQSVLALFHVCDTKLVRERSKASVYASS